MKRERKSTKCPVYTVCVGDARLLQRSAAIFRYGVQMTLSSIYRFEVNPAVINLDGEFCFF